MKVLLVGNYEFDGSTSMKIWARMLLHELQQRGIDVRLITPPPILGRMKGTADGLGKWVGYIDRFGIFPFRLRSEAAWADVVHLCDHGSAMYVQHLKNKPVVVTCHDMLAVRGSMGEVPDCQASFFGRSLQSWICSGLQCATRVVCISQATYCDAARILKSSKNLCLIMNGLNYPFHPIPQEEAERRLAVLPVVREPYILHIGSNLLRKNREGVLRIFAEAARGTNLHMVFAGAALNGKSMELAKELNIYERVIQVVKPEVEVIEALYNRATAMIFPSRYEGFGWPPIEAQACGCPVVGSDITPFVEVLGQSAVLKHVEDEAGMAAALRKFLTDREYRDQMQQRGFNNVRTRFQTSRMIDEYMSLYQELTCEK